MSPTSAFGNLLTQYRARKPGLTQTRLAILAGYDPPLVTRMCQGKKELTGPSGRDRALRLMVVLCDEGVLATQAEANALLQAAGMPPLYQGAATEAALLRRLKAAASAPSPVLRRTNLSAPLTRFIGRQHQMDELKRLLNPHPGPPLEEGEAATRLLTLTGRVAWAKHAWHWRPGGRSRLEAGHIWHFPTAYGWSNWRPSPTLHCCPKPSWPPSTCRNIQIARPGKSCWRTWQTSDYCSSSTTAST